MNHYFDLAYLPDDMTIDEMLDYFKTNGIAFADLSQGVLTSFPGIAVGSPEWHQEIINKIKNK